MVKDADQLVGQSTAAVIKAASAELINQLAARGLLKTDETPVAAANEKKPPVEPFAGKETAEEEAAEVATGRADLDTAAAEVANKEQIPVAEAKQEIKDASAEVEVADTGKTEDDEAPKSFIEKTVVKLAKAHGVTDNNGLLTVVSSVLNHVADMRLSSLGKAEASVWKPELEKIAETFIRAAAAQALNTKPAVNKADSGGEEAMTLNKADLAKAAKVKEHIGAMSTGFDDYIKKCTDLQAAHATNMKDQFGQLHKLLGFDAPDVPAPMDVESKATASPTLEEKPAEKAIGTSDLTKADVMEMVDNAVFAALTAVAGGETVVKSLLAATGTEESMAKATPGIGDRNDGSLMANHNAVIRVMPVTKAADTSNVGENRMMNAVIPQTPEVVDAAVVQKALSGDTASLMKMMGGVQPSAIPQTLVGLVGGKMSR